MQVESALGTERVAPFVCPRSQGCDDLHELQTGLRQQVAIITQFNQFGFSQLIQPRVQYTG